VSLSERVGSLGALRCGFVLAVLGLGVLAPELLEIPPRGLILGSAAYLLLLLMPWIVRGQPRSRALRIVGASLLLDGVYLAWIVYATGGTQSPLAFLVLVDVVAVTLLASFRTGLKLAAWNSLLFLLVLYAQAAAIIPVREALTAALPGSSDFATVSMRQLAALWVVAVATAASSAVNERQLRSQRADLEGLSAMVRDLDLRPTADEIPRVLLDALGRTFGFPRGLVLASPQGHPRVVAVVGIDGIDPANVAQPGADRIVERAWEERRSQLVRTLDADANPGLAGMLPAARNVLVVPLLAEGGGRIGAVAVEHPGRRPRIRRWAVAIVEQFASHAALTLNGAWLRERLEHQLEENRTLHRRLQEHNLELEAKVQVRTRDLTESLRDLRVAHEQRRRLLAHLVHAEEEERKRIAGDVHDDPVQKMVAATMWIQVLRRTLSDPEQLEAAEKVLATVRDSIDSLRHMIFELRPEVLDREGLAHALREYLESLGAHFEFRVEDRLDEEPPGEVRVVLYRIAQEALANVGKHARASRVEVLVDRRDGGYLVCVADDGIGFHPAMVRSARGHLGLSSMRERAELAGGRCRVDSAPGEGTRVELWLPGGPQAPERRGPESAENAELLPVGRPVSR